MCVYVTCIFTMVQCILAQWFIIWVMPSQLPQSCIVLLPINSESVRTTGRKKERRREGATISQTLGELQTQCSDVFFSTMWLINSLFFWCLLVFLFFFPMLPLFSNAIDLCNRLLIVSLSLSLLNSSIFHFSFCCFYNNHRTVFPPPCASIPNPAPATLNQPLVITQLICPLKMPLFCRRPPLVLSPFAAIRGLRVPLLVLLHGR